MACVAVASSSRVSEGMSSVRVSAPGAFRWRDLAGGLGIAEPSVAGGLQHRGHNLVADRPLRDAGELGQADEAGALAREPGTGQCNRRRLARPGVVLDHGQQSCREVVGEVFLFDIRHSCDQGREEHYAALGGRILARVVFGTGDRERQQGTDQLPLLVGGEAGGRCRDRPAPRRRTSVALVPSIARVSAYAWERMVSVNRLGCWVNAARARADHSHVSSLGPCRWGCRTVPVRLPVGGLEEFLLGHLFDRKAGVAADGGIAGAQPPENQGEIRPRWPEPG